jgi:hypothetical protein
VPQNVLMLVVLYGRETWPHKLREEGAEENIWTGEGGSDGRLEKTA